MSAWLLVAVTGAYLWTSALQFSNGNPAVGVMFLGYSVANLGILGVMK